MTQDGLDMLLSSKLQGLRGLQTDHVTIYWNGIVLRSYKFQIMVHALSMLALEWGK